MDNSTAVDDASESARYPFGLSSNRFAVLLAVIGIIGPGILVYTLEQANLSWVADIVWIVGYGTTAFVVWFVWLRPLDLVGAAAQDIDFDAKQDSPSDTEQDSASDAEQDATSETPTESEEGTARPSGTDVESPRDNGE